MKIDRSITVGRPRAEVYQFWRAKLVAVWGCGPVGQFCIQNGDIDPSFVVTHRLALDEAPHAYEIFREKEDKCIKVVLKP